MNNSNEMNISSSNMPLVEESSNSEVTQSEAQQNTQPLIDFAMQLDNANSVIPDAIALYYLRKAGLLVFFSGFHTPVEQS